MGLSPFRVRTAVRCGFLGLLAGTLPVLVTGDVCPGLEQPLRPRPVWESAAFGFVLAASTYIGFHGLAWTIAGRRPPGLLLAMATGLVLAAPLSVLAYGLALGSDVPVARMAADLWLLVTVMVSIGITRGSRTALWFPPRPWATLLSGGDCRRADQARALKQLRPGPAAPSPLCNPVANGAPDRQPRPRHARRLKRMPDGLEGDVICLGASDRYVEVFTTNGQGRVLRRLKDAIRDLPPDAGLRVHRCWWVATGAVVGTERDARGFLRLRLITGRIVPVARTREPEVLTALGSVGLETAAPHGRQPHTANRLR